MILLAAVTRAQATMTFGAFTVPTTSLCLQQSLYLATPSPTKLYHSWHNGTYWSNRQPPGAHYFVPIQPVQWPFQRPTTPINIASQDYNHRVRIHQLATTLQYHPSLPSSRVSPVHFEYYIVWQLPRWERMLLSDIDMLLLPSNEICQLLTSPEEIMIAGC